MKQNNSTELLAYSKFAMQGKNDPPDRPRPQLRIFTRKPYRAPIELLKSP